MKTAGGLRKLRHRGGALVAWVFTFTAAAYNIVPDAPLAGGNRLISDTQYESEPADGTLEVVNLPPMTKRRSP